MGKLMNFEGGKREVAPTTMGFNNSSGFELIQRAAKCLASSNIVPKEYQGNIANCIVALEMANRMRVSPLAVMQSLYIVHGRPGWSASFIVGAINATGRFSPLRYRMTGNEGNDDRTCVAWAKDDDGEVLESPPVSIGMAKAEGWFQKSGSKWQTMPDLMLRYRAATLFGRLYAPDLLMGIQTEDEVMDVRGQSAEAEINQIRSLEVDADAVDSDSDEEPTDDSVRVGIRARIIDAASKQDSESPKSLAEAIAGKALEECSVSELQEVLASIS